MAVAKTYEKMELIGEPFKENGRMYVYVKAPKGQKKVRWYSDTEYRKMYPDAATTNDIMDFDARHAFGFGPEGFITIYRGSNVEEWANEDRTNIYYTCSFGYYTPGRLDTPHLKNGIEPIKLMWEEVMDYDDRMKPHAVVQKIVAEKLGTLCNSEYQGNMNEWLQKEVTVREKKSNETHFGTKHIYTLVDANGNIYAWETSAKDYAINKVVSLKMKVKEHKKINGIPTTVVWYCKEC